MTTFVLVHGAFVGGWCWRWVAPALRERGHEVLTPTLTGLGERVHLASPNVDLDTHIGDVCDVVRRLGPGGVVLVGWSYGGMVVAGAADRAPDRVASLVYVDADVPSDGDTSAPRSQHAERTALATAYGDGWRVPAAATGAASHLVDELLPAQRRWVLARLAPHPLATWLQPIRLSGAGDALPTTYIRRTVGYDPNDEDTRRQDDRIRSQPGWRHVELMASHAAPFTCPRDLARVLLEAAGAS